MWVIFADDAFFIMTVRKLIYLRDMLIMFPLAHEIIKKWTSDTEQKHLGGFIF